MDLSSYKDAFLAAARVHISNFTNNLELLTQNPSDSELISEIHRSIHSLGSQCFAMNFKETGEYARVIEGYFYKLKNGEEFKKDKLDTIKNALNDISESLNRIEKENTESVLAEKLAELQGGLE